MNDVIIVKNLQKKFKQKVVFSNLNLEVETGKITTIYGESGSGKSTLLNIIGLLEKPNSGEISLFGKKAPKVGSVQARKLLRNKISYLFQNFALLTDQTIDQNLNIVHFDHHESKVDFEKRKKELLKKLNVDFPGNTKVGTLSGGEQQRIAMVRALLKPGELILCDEPTGSLDPKNKEKIFSALEYAKGKGKTVLIVSHDPYIIDNSDVTYSIDDLMK